MSKLIRTTINLPKDLIKEAKIYAAVNDTNLSELIRTTLRDAIGNQYSTHQSSLEELAGSLDLPKRKIPTREELYEKHLKHKMGY